MVPRLFVRFSILAGLVSSFLSFNELHQLTKTPQTSSEPSVGTGFKQGIIARTQDCEPNTPSDDPSSISCTFCGGAESKASFFTFSELKDDGSFTFVDDKSVVFASGDDSDSWGTEDPRVQYNPNDGLYYMFYTAYNGSSILLNLVTSPDPTAPNDWVRHGPVFPSFQGSKSAALLIDSPPPGEEAANLLFWGCDVIRVANSTSLTAWPSDGGRVLLEPRPGFFDSQLVESGPPPLRLSTGDYVFFYNSAEIGWPKEEGSAYHVGYVILDGSDPTVVLSRSDVPLLSPEYPFEKGLAPYGCNAPNVIFLEGARALGGDKFAVYFGGADATGGTAVIEVAVE